MIDWQNPSQKISKFFSVGEVTNGDARRTPVTGSEVEKAILSLARELDKIREDWGNPIKVTSWYRPPSINATVGGVAGSTHTRGIAADIRPVAARDLYGFQTYLDAHWFGALGYGAPKGFVHVDTRNGRGWKSGGTKGPRWNY